MATATLSRPAASVHTLWAGVRLSAEYKRPNYCGSSTAPVPTRTRSFEVWRWTNDPVAIADAPLDGVIFAEDRDTFARLLNDKLDVPSYCSRVVEYNDRDNLHFVPYEERSDLARGDLVVQSAVRLDDFVHDRYPGDEAASSSYGRDFQGYTGTLPDAEELVEMAAGCAKGTLIQLSENQRKAVHSEARFRVFYDLCLPLGFLLRHGAKRSYDADASFLRFDPVAASRALARPYVGRTEVVRRPKEDALKQLSRAIECQIDKALAERANRHFRKQGYGSFLVVKRESGSYPNEASDYYLLASKLPNLIRLSRKITGQRWAYLGASTNEYQAKAFAEQILALEPSLRLFEKSKVEGDKKFAAFLKAELPLVRTWQKKLEAQRQRERALHEANAKIFVAYSYQKRAFWQGGLRWGSPKTALHFVREEAQVLRNRPSRKYGVSLYDLNDTYVTGWQPPRPKAKSASKKESAHETLAS